MNALKMQLGKYAKARRKKKFTKHLSSSIAKRIGKLLIFLIALIGANTVFLHHLEGMSYGDALWMSLVTVVTVGYGELVPATTGGRIVTIISLFAFGITILTLLISEFVEWRLVITEKRLKGFWEWKKMNDHIQIINTPNLDTERYLTRLVSEIGNTESLKDHTINLLSRKYSDGLPQELVELKVLHRTGAAEDAGTLNSINIDRAAYIVVLARDSSDTLSDSATFDVLSQIKSINTKARIIVEAVSDDNQQRFSDAGADVVIRPIRAYPEMVVRSMVNPGTERVIEDLLHASGDSLYREDIRFFEKKWIDVVIAGLTTGCGTPIAYLEEGELKMHPDAHEVCSGEGLILLSKQHKMKNALDLLNAFAPS